MSQINLNAMSLQDLRRLQKDVDRAVANYEDRKKAEALAALEAKARELGFTVAELTGGVAKKTRAPGIAKYRHPENPSITYSGRGRRPDWFDRAIEI